jgi:hypothetical protein
MSQQLNLAFHEFTSTRLALGELLQTALEKRLSGGSFVCGILAGISSDGSRWLASIGEICWRIGVFGVQLWAPAARPA